MLPSGVEVVDSNGRVDGAFTDHTRIYSQTQFTDNGSILVRVLINVLTLTLQ